jgi:hypothetical protein
MFGRQIISTVALAAVLVVGAPTSASAASNFGSAGQGYTQLYCNSATRTVTISVNVFTNVVPQSVGYNLYVWVGTGWYLFSSSTGTPEGSYMAFQSRLGPITGAYRTHYFYTEYFWFSNGAWRMGLPKGEQTQINC